jgi:4-hydroxyphenylpyruvate dioxygenase-like putative hemolysin
MNLLVMAPEPVDVATVSGALGGEDLSDARILYVSPALNESAVAFWVSDSDEAIAEARDRAVQTERALRAEGVQHAAGVTGESEPLLALQDALAAFDAERIVVFVHDDDEQRYREDDVLGEAERRFGVPVTEARI